MVSEGFEIIMIGHAGHVEVEGTMGQAPDSMHLVETVEDVATIAVRNEERLGCVTQTTLSVDDTRDVMKALAARFPKIVLPKRDDICYATQNRQDAVKELAARCDLILVVGSPNSSNSNRLKEIAIKSGTPAYLIDGADGLAGSLALIALLSVAAVAGVENVGSAMAMTVSGAIVGFLIFNFPTPWNRKARTFMGDAGSTLLGFTIVWVTLGVSQGSERVVSPVVCLWFASIPIYDLLTCFVQRVLSGRSPFEPGRDHFHHKLERAGIGVRETLGILTGLQAIYAMIGIAAHSAGIPDVFMFAAWSVLGLTQHLIIVSISRFRARSLSSE